MSARHRRKIRDRANLQRQEKMLERFFTMGARVLFVRYLKETLLPRFAERERES